VRLFTALWVPPAAAAALRAVSTPDAVPPGWRAVDPQTWHLTLAFHGEAEPEQLASALHAGAHGAPAPRLRLSGAGSFRGVHWMGVQAEPADRLSALVAAAGGDPGEFVPHVTLLRRRGRGRSPGPDRPPWSDHRGPWWRPTTVLLVRSEPGRGGPHYRVVHRVPLGPG
jgi:RNA 2',3'-cyclic 3'-phosphodiesterase